MRQTVTGTKNKSETMIKSNTSTISENQSKENQTSDKVSVSTKEDKKQKINRFIKQTEKNLKKFQQEQENETTMIKTKQHVNLFQDCIKETEDDSTPIHEIDPVIFYHFLSAFFVGIRKKDGSEY
jgi:hypothetical protein